jgi:octanoyl-[GcvH]:protein N-octanoyltransferase
VLLVRESFPGRPALSTAVSRAILLRVSRRELPDTLRLHRPNASVAFGRQDVASAGYADAIRAARSQGFEAIERLAGGRAAVFHEETIAFSWATADPDPHTRTFERFRAMAESVVAGLRALGIDARVGEVPGEYCPGEYSVNARGRAKLVGLGQRIIAGGAHLGGVLVVGGSDRVRDVLVPVYEALGLDWNPATVGSVVDEAPGTAYEDVVQALLDQFSSRWTPAHVPLDEDTLALAAVLEPEHLSPPFATDVSPP